jgi:outer membrane protein assembly factor BamB
MFSQAWGSPLIVDGKVYIGNEVGAILVFEHSKEMNMLAENDMGNSVFSTPIVANNTLFVTNKNALFAIGQKSASEGQ